MHKIINGVSLQEFMARLGDSETNVCALLGQSDNGWQTKLAWQPKEVLSVTELDDVSNLEDFTAQAKGSGRLVIGYLSYGLGAELTGVNVKPDGLGTPLAYLAAFDNWLVFDDDRIAIITNDQDYIDAVEQICASLPRVSSAKLYNDGLSPTVTRKQYKQSFEQAKHHIMAGDVYQINLAHRLAGTSKADSKSMLNVLSNGSGVGFGAYIEDGDREIISLSPERFIKITGRSITTSPIKGTRPRGTTQEADDQLSKELIRSQKDLAELNMITDLLRNDLGKICRTGSVEVEVRRALTAHPTVWHTHSTIVGELLDNISPVRALIDMSPGGSITGCPKKRAVEIIDELEPVGRGVYTGSIFAVEPNGNLDSNIAIRTLIKRGSDVYLSVGGGIVHESEETAEYRETLDKAAAFVRWQ